MRTEAFLWSPLLPAAQRGTKWDGIMHISDWWATYLAAAGATPSADTGPRAPDAKNLWPAILSGGQSPRTEVVHMVHNEQYCATHAFLLLEPSCLFFRADAE